VKRAARLCPLVALASLSGCWHEAFHTSVENGTTKPISAVIRFHDESIPPGHGSIEPGNGVSLPQKIEDISSIEYQIDGHECRMDAKMIAGVARTSTDGVASIALTDCAQTNG
jgi:hypothetical protein